MELAAIARFVKRSIKGDTRAGLIARLEANAAITHGTHEGNYPRTGCGFLTDDGRCSIYEVRPLPCARAHSRSRVACETSTDVPLLTGVLGETAAIWIGFRDGVHAVASETYELQEAALIVIRDGVDPLSAKGQQALDCAKSVPTPQEVLDQIEFLPTPRGQ